MRNPKVLNRSGLVEMHISHFLVLLIPAGHCRDILDNLSEYQMRGKVVGCCVA